MAILYRIYTEGNLIKVAKEVDTLVTRVSEGFRGSSSASVMITTLSESETDSIKIDGLRNNDGGVPSTYQLTDLIDKDGNPFADMATFMTWASNNTGMFSSGGAGGLVDTSSLATQAKQDELKTETEAVKIAVQLTDWNTKAGNIKEITYYSTIPEASNPSGNKNPKTITYKTGATVVITQTLTYDLDDDVLTITTI